MAEERDKRSVLPVRCENCGWSIPVPAEVDQLLAEVERLRAENEKLRQALNEEEKP